MSLTGLSESQTVAPGDTACRIPNPYSKPCLQREAITYLSSRTNAFGQCPIFRNQESPNELHTSENPFAKPTVHTEALPRGGRQLHNATGPALESDVVSRYFWHGVLVPAHVVVNPAQITQEEIRAASNMEVRRVLIERYGYEQYLRDASLTLVDACPDDHLLPGLRSARLFRDDQNQIVLLDMLNSTPESNGSFKRYVISVDGNAYEGRAGKECLAAMASTWRRQSDYSLYFQTPEAYRPMAES